MLSVSVSLEVEPVKLRTSDVCECCGRISREFTGFVHEGEATLAGYVLQWTVGHFPDVAANLDLVVGMWGEEAGPDQRRAICLEVRLRDGRPDLLVIDAAGRSISQNILVGGSLSRAEVIGTPIADQVFAIADAIFAQDPRLPVIFESE